MTTMTPHIMVLVLEKEQSHWGSAKSSLVPLG